MKHKFKLPKDFTPTLEIKNGFAIIDIPDAKHPIIYQDEIVSFYKDGELFISVFEKFTSDKSFKSRACLNFSLRKLTIKDQILEFDSIRKSHKRETTLFHDMLSDRQLDYINGNFVQFRAYNTRLYYQIDPDFEISKRYISQKDNKGIISKGNCFATRTIAKVIRDKFIEILNEYHKKLQDDTRSEDSNWM